MDLETPFYKSRAQGAYRFDPWTAEVATMNHAAANLAGLVNGVGSLIAGAFRALGRAVQALRQAAPVEIEPVKIAHPAHVNANTANDRAAA